MSARSFHSVFMVASCAGAALGCYLVSLRVASERAALEDVETKIVLAQRDMRVLQTEIGTRGRLSQLERWNASAFALSAPVGGPVPRGRLRARATRPARAQGRFPGAGGACLRAAPAPRKAPLVSPRPTIPALQRRRARAQLLHEASLKTRDARGPGADGRRIAPGNRQIHGQAGNCG